MSFVSLSDAPASAQPWTLALSECHDVSQVGGKAINLARLLAAGFNVPEGFVVTTSAFRAARRDDGAASVGADLAAQVRARYQAMGRPMVAVRSSATAEDMAQASMAGQYETFLNVEGDEQLLDTIGRCWASIDSPRIRAYLAQHGIEHRQVAMAVVIQRLVRAEVAGVLFTVNPRGGRPGGEATMLIEASWGLGEMVVSGEVQPDTLTVGRDTGAVVDAHIAPKTHRLRAGVREIEEVPPADRHRPCLSSREVDALRQLGLAVEKHYGSPQDLEWALAAGRVHLLQSRAITTIAADQLAAGIEAQTLADLRQRLAAGDGPWVAHNLGETLPHPTPLTWSLMEQFHTAGGGFGSLYRRVGFRPGPKLAQRGMLDLIAGRIYMNLALAGEMFAADFPFAYDVRAVKGDPNAGQAPPTVPVGSPKARLAAARLLARAGAKLDELAATFDRQYTQQIAPAFVAWCAGQKAIDLSGLSNAELAATFEAQRAEVLDEFAPQSLLPTFIAGHVTHRFRSLLAESFWDDDATSLALELGAGGPADRTVQADHDLYELAHGRMAEAAWLAVHGHRGAGEFDLAAPRWRDRPGAVAKLAQALRGGDDPLARHQRHAADAGELARRKRAELCPDDRRRFDELLDLLRRYLPFRENAKDDLMRGYEVLRRTAREVGRRWGIGEDVFLLTWEELRASLGTGFAPIALIEQRKTRRAAEAKIDLPAFVDGTPAAASTPAAPTSSIAGEGRFAGFAIAPGRGGGPVAVLARPEDGADLRRGYVLICRSTDPSWTPLFVNAAAVVLERGGSLSHGAVVAREMAIPAVVLPGATTLFRDGEILSVDGHTGSICRGDRSAERSAPADQATALVPAQVPPPPGARERRAAGLRLASLIGWTVFLLGFFTLPRPWLRGPVTDLLDAALWPLVTGLGRTGAVAAIAVALAVLTMLGQRLLTDHRRLVTAKHRARSLQKRAAKLPADDPTRRRMLQLAAPVQGRVLGASFVPLAVLLGPLVVTFIWLGERVDPLLSVAAPGGSVPIIATVEGDYVQPVSIEVGQGLAVVDTSPVAQTIPPVRQALGELRAQWEQDSDLASLPWEVRSAARMHRQQMLADLEAFLAGPMKEQQLAWTVQLPTAEGVYQATIRAGDQQLTVPLAVGRGAPPQPPVTDGRPQPVQQVKVVYPPVPARDAIFCQPFAALGWTWDIGWLGVYIALYLPAMLLIKAVLRVP